MCASCDLLLVKVLGDIGVRVTLEEKDRDRKFMTLTCEGRNLHWKQEWKQENEDAAHLSSKGNKGKRCVPPPLHTTARCGRLRARGVRAPSWQCRLFSGVEGLQCSVSSFQLARACRYEEAKKWFQARTGRVEALSPDLLLATTLPTGRKAPFATCRVVGSELC